ncbi:MAG: 1-(5-phosphoribosyl)-5-[(5-phosphoribosylamino)methylideneamino]imidazole-4-carboxamide isomerase [Desulfovibrio sp.]|nr:1-(5-phosphoribosyl)-5-[(5-phosphoribosylamino)methylideneamino]imidazole-4-carboxamide isomerase [Desulfovibrio sp.]
MTIFPAVDIQGGKAVRLERGRKEQATVFADDPLDLARRWQEQGAQWLHIVDLDGAFAGDSSNLNAIAAIASTTGLPCQVGGGIRTVAAARRYLESGATRLIIGTAALEDPDSFAAMCAAFPGRIGISLDAEKGRLKSRGWVRDADRTVADVLPGVSQAGAAFVIYTDIERDGMKTGPNLAALAWLLEHTGLPVIAAGGISSLADVKAVAALARLGNLEGVISGRAISDGSLSLADALAWLAGNV